MNQIIRQQPTFQNFDKISEFIKAESYILLVSFFQVYTFCLIIENIENLLMGICSSAAQSKKISCIKLPLKNVTNNLEKSGQLYSFKKGLENSDQKKKLKWDQLFSSNFSYRQNTSYETQTQGKTGRYLQKDEQTSQIKLFQKKNTQNLAQLKAQKKQLTSQQINYKLTRQDIQRFYEGRTNDDKLVMHDKAQQLPRHERKIIKKFKNSTKSNSNVVIPKQGKEKVEVPMIERQASDKRINSLENYEPSLIMCLQNQQKFEGMNVKRQKSTITNIRISSSNIEFVLLKNRAGPIIVSEICYDYYTI